MERYIIVLIGLFALVVRPSAAAVYTDIIAPSSANGVEGNSSQIPLDTGSFPARFQQVYSSSLFGGFPQGLSIGEIVFRVDKYTGHGLDTTIANVEFHLSTTANQPDGLSPNFDVNVGSDDTIVIDRSPRHLTAGGPFGSGPSTFSVGFDFTSHPFIYNPSLGNLLLDIKVFNGANTSPLDAVDMVGDSVSSVFAYGDPMPSSGQTSSLGLATEFAVQPIPEPSTVALLVVGLVGLGASRFTRVSRKVKAE
jgi:hypothetical protein